MGHSPEDDMKSVSYSKTRNTNMGRIVPRPDAREADMPMPDGSSIRFAVSSVLAERGRTSRDRDAWKVSISRPGAPVPSMVIDYRTGSGHRMTVRESMGNPADDTVPVEPSARDVLMAIGNDVSTHLELPSSDEAALTHLQRELGVEDAGEALRILRALRKESDDVASLIGGASRLSDFVEWTRELETEPNDRHAARGSFRIALPVATDESGGQAGGYLDVAIGSETARRRTDGTMSDGPLKTLSITGSLKERDSERARWRTSSMGQCVDEVGRIWAGYPSVVELCGIWNRYHLNQMNPGTDAQDAILGAHSENGVEYEKAVEILKGAGMLDDPSVTGRGGRPYRYGSEWLAREIPEEVFARLRELSLDIPGETPVPEEPTSTSPRP